MLATGIDLIEIARIEEALERFGARFLDRVYTPAEQRACGRRAPSLAARWAAKEAASKALGVGIGDVRWVEIEVV
ncbi:MAG TPA: holo-ACP synthase, partial [Ardenticatenaceae bacterium]|nr:holo-ACP synthase [Ardenticatenaceae bacterium]